jgi:hypothetical protein
VHFQVVLPGGGVVTVSDGAVIRHHFVPTVVPQVVVVGIELCINFAAIVALVSKSVRACKKLPIKLVYKSKEGFNSSLESQFYV